MRAPPGKCLFCLSNAGPFLRVEHPIPESLGNDDLVLPLGFVCDGCNQYFGSKIEKHVLESMPFAGVRIMLNVPNKKGRLTHFTCKDHYSVFPTTYRDLVLFAGRQPIIDAAMEGRAIPAPQFPEDDWLMARFLLKMGLELLLTDDLVNPFDAEFNGSRRFSRCPNVGDSWRFATGRYPRRDDLINYSFIRDGETWLNENLYQYSIGKMANRDVYFAFLYRDHYFAINLNSPNCTAYVEEFNVMNEFLLQIIVARHPASNSGTKAGSI